MTDPTDQTTTRTADTIENDSGNPAAHVVRGFGQYFELVRHQMDLQREFTMTWATALTSVSAAVLGQLHTVEHILAGQADQLAQQAHGAERVTRGMAEQVVIAEKALGSWADHQPAAPTAVHHRIPTQRTVKPATATRRAATQRTATQRAATYWTTTRLTATEQASAEPTAADHDQVRVTPDIFDELIEFIVDEDIKAAIP